MKVTILIDPTISGLNSKINELLADGWEPLGGHQVITRRNVNRYSGTQHMDTLFSIEYSITMILKSESHGGPG